MCVRACASVCVGMREEGKHGPYFNPMVTVTLEDSPPESCTVAVFYTSSGSRHYLLFNVLGTWSVLL